MELLSISQAAQRGIERVRLPRWANPLDHIKIDLVPGGVGPWLHLYAPFNKECNGRDPVSFLWMIGPMKTDIEEVAFEPYTGGSGVHRKAWAQNSVKLGDILAIFPVKT